MLFRLTYCITILLFTISLFSCKAKQAAYDDLHSDKKPSELAKEQATMIKKQNRAYKREKRRLQREIDKRNKQRLKGQYYDK
ncbi:MAG TPA: hypothetical protein PKO16_06905 [Bacteroidia bacterium]|jgi:hypothetical protein|nr:hypothetical protein [Bacteroidia bacterium]